MSEASNGTCHKETAESSPPLFQDGHIVLQTHHIGWIISGAFAMIATVTSIWLVNKHLQWYNNKREQRYIVRLLFMVPIYALVSFASFLFWNHSTPLILVRDGYESTVLTAFFYLLLMYLSSEPEEQRSIFLRVGLSREADREALKKGEEVKKWVFPLGFIKWKPQDGLYFLQLMKWGVLQYCVIRPTTTLAAVILDYMGLYCEESWGLGWGHIYITVIVSLSVTIAMYCLIQLYVPVAANLAPHKPLLKLFAIKAVVFLTFWQATFLSMLSLFGVVKDTKYMTAADINIGIGALLETFEMMLFAFLHIHAFTYRPYRPPHPSNPTELFSPHTPRLRSLGHAMDFRETFREIWIGWVYIFDKMRGREPNIDIGPRRAAHYEGVFGKPRHLHPAGGINPRGTQREHHEKPRATLPVVEIEVEEQVDVEVEGERQWLGLGDDYGYGLGYVRREKSEGLEVQIEKELERRGYAIHTLGIDGVDHLPEEDTRNQRRQPSWWRRIYNRISEHGSEHEDQGLGLIPHGSRRRSRRLSLLTRDPDQDFHFNYEPEIDDPPSSSFIHDRRGRRNGDFRRTAGADDILTPLPIFKEGDLHPSKFSNRDPILSSPRINPLSLNVDTYETTSLFSVPTMSVKSDDAYIRGDSIQRRTVGESALLLSNGRSLVPTATRQAPSRYPQNSDHRHAPPPLIAEVVNSPPPTRVEDFDMPQYLHRRESAHSQLVSLSGKKRHVVLANGNTNESYNGIPDTDDITHTFHPLQQRIPLHSKSDDPNTVYNRKLSSPQVPRQTHIRP